MENHRGKLAPELNAFILMFWFGCCIVNSSFKVHIKIVVEISVSLDSIVTAAVLTRLVIVALDFLLFNLSIACHFQDSLNIV